MSASDEHIYGNTMGSTTCSKEWSGGGASHRIHVVRLQLAVTGTNAGMHNVSNVSVYKGYKGGLCTCCMQDSLYKRSYVWQDCP
jgi:hypothetical protein